VEGYYGRQPLPEVQPVSDGDNEPDRKNRTSLPEVPASRIDEPSKIGQNPFGQLVHMFSKVFIAVTTFFVRYGFGMKSAFAGICSGRALPVVMMMWTGGHLSKKSRAEI
jgi:hypothetical protein